MRGQQKHVPHMQDSDNTSVAHILATYRLRVLIPASLGMTGGVWDVWREHIDHRQQGSLSSRGSVAPLPRGLSALSLCRLGPGLGRWADVQTPVCVGVVTGLSAPSCGGDLSPRSVRFYAAGRRDFDD